MIQGEIEWYATNKGLIYQNIDRWESLLNHVKAVKEQFMRDGRFCASCCCGESEFMVKFEERKILWKLAAMCLFTREEYNEIQLAEQALPHLRYLLKVIDNHENRKDIVDLEEVKKYPIEQLLRELNIDVIRGMISCPVHQEKTPSCKVYFRTNSWHCFGCGAGGSVIDLVMSVNRCDFKDAVKFLS